MKKQSRWFNRYNVLSDSWEIPGLSNNTTRYLKQRMITKNFIFYEFISLIEEALSK